ncbi:hypothetical protein SAMN05660420_01049 [Desulfuromusa kysingii]|uniref:Uncharacterized protein n=1 Tax=Desulfuromusa kysingii TaxID=37625 RepID=A0A1H3XPQ7_9BACT|nr:hypothetical protein [Desulfuromusa kysingii]SEA00881.1 hypothetical protein SAMN05660420_01049 [Desulfuromusa kysingii]
MFVWKGWGIVVPLIYLLLTTGVREVLNTAGMDDDWALTAGIVLSAISLWFIGKKLNDPGKGKRVIDVDTGEEMLLVNTHTFFWIKAEYWAFIVPILLAAIAFSQR